jgi:hypothetical protein
MHRRSLPYCSLLFVVSLLVACDSTPKIGKFENLLGVQGPQLWSISFDSKNHPLVGGSGLAGSRGALRYTDADGWVLVGKSDAQINRFFPADDGGAYAVAGTALYKINVDAPEWTMVQSLAQTGAVVNVNYVAGDGTMYGALTGGAQQSVYRRIGGNAWLPLNSAADPFGSTTKIADKTHNLYFFPPNQDVVRRDAGASTEHVFIDCHTKDLLQCQLDLFPIQFDGDGALYLETHAPLAIRVYRVGASGGTPTLVAALPSGDPPNDYTYFASASVTANGTVYLAGKRSSDAYSFGSTFRFKPGEPSGTMFLASPSDQEAPGGITPAPSANIAVAPDDTVYAWLPVNGGVSRFVP